MYPVVWSQAPMKNDAQKWSDVIRWDRRQLHLQKMQQQQLQLATERMGRERQLLLATLGVSPSSTACCKSLDLGRPFSLCFHISHFQSKNLEQNFITYSRCADGRTTPLFQSLFGAFALALAARLHHLMQQQQRLQSQMAMPQMPQSCSLPHSMPGSPGFDALSLGWVKSNSWAAFWGWEGQILCLHLVAFGLSTLGK